MRKSIVALSLALVLLLGCVSVSLAEDTPSYPAQYITNEVLAIDGLLDSSENRALMVALGMLEYIAMGGDTADLNMTDPLIGFYKGSSSLDIFIRSGKDSDKYVNLFFPGDGNFYIYEYSIAWIAASDTYADYDTCTIDELNAALNQLFD